MGVCSFGLTSLEVLFVLGDDLGLGFKNTMRFQCDDLTSEVGSCDKVTHLVEQGECVLEG